MKTDPFEEVFKHKQVVIQQPVFPQPEIKDKPSVTEQPVIPQPEIKEFDTVGKCHLDKYPTPLKKLLALSALSADFAGAF